MQEKTEYLFDIFLQYGWQYPSYYCGGWIPKFLLA